MHAQPSKPPAAGARKRPQRKRPARAPAPKGASAHRVCSLLEAAANEEFLEELAIASLVEVAAGDAEEDKEDEEGGYDDDEDGCLVAKPVRKLSTEERLLAQMKTVIGRR